MNQDYKLKRYPNCDPVSKEHSCGVAGEAEAAPLSRAASGVPGASALLVPVILIAASFTVYLHTANPLFRFSDGGELAAAAHTLGVAHPTGYPLFLMGEKLWSFLLPIGNPCFRANLLSAICASVALALIFLLCFRVAGPLSGLLAAGLLGFSETFWLQATQSTVYTLNLMLVALLTGLAFGAPGGRLESPPHTLSTFDFRLSTFQRTATVFFFVLGLGLCNHLTLALVPVALVLSHPRAFGRLLGCGEQHPYRCKRGVAVVALVFLLAGLSVYLYLPVRAAAHPAINWGAPSIWQRLWEHLTQHDYKFKQASRTFSEHATVTLAFFGSVAKELGLCGAALALIGLIGGLFRRRGLTMYLILLSLGTLLVALLYGEGTYLEPVYCLPAYFAAAVFAGFGLNDLLLSLKSKVQSPKSNRQPPTANRQRTFLATGVALLLAISPIVLFASNYHRCDSSRNFYAYWHGLNLLKTMPLGSTFFGETDTALFPLYYLKFVEGRRPDVRIYDRKWRVIEYFEQVDLQSCYNREMRIIEGAHDGPVFYAEYPTVPAINIKLFGILLEAFLAEPQTGTIDFKRLYSDFLNEPEEEVFIDKWTQETRATYFLLWGHQCELQNHLAEAEAHFSEASRLGNDNAGLMNNLSIYYERAGMGDKAASAMERAAELEPRNARFLTRLGILYYNLARLGQANYNMTRLDQGIAALERSVAIDAENPDATIYLANSFLLKGDQSEAERYLKKTLDITPHNTYAHNNLGFIYKSQRRFDEAAEHFKEAIRIGTDSYLPYFNLASVYALKGDTENALKWLERGRRYMSKEVVESIRGHADFDSIRGDPRFDKILNSDD